MTSSDDPKPALTQGAEAIIKAGKAARSTSAYYEQRGDLRAAKEWSAHADAIQAATALERLAGERGGEALEAAQGIEWFERTFGVPLGDMPGRVDVEQIRALAALAPQPLPGEKKE